VSQPQTGQPLAGTPLAQRTGIFIAVAVITAAVLIGGGLYLFENQSCTVGVYGTDLEVTARGPNSPNYCQMLLGPNSAGLQTYRIDQPDSSATLMCNVTVSDGTQVTVRDKGVLKLYGSAVGH
jgi:hypothetical protein